MPQHPLDLDASSLDTIDLVRLEQALASLREVLGPLPGMTPQERARRFKMGPKTEGFCRQVLALLEANPGVVPPVFELARMQARMAQFDVLRAQQLELTRMARLLDDARLRMGMELAKQARQGYKALRQAGAAGLEPLQAGFRARYARKPRGSKQNTAAD